MTIEQFEELKYIISMIDLERDWNAEDSQAERRDKGVRHRG